MTTKCLIRILWNVLYTLKVIFQGTFSECSWRAFPYLCGLMNEQRYWGRSMLARNYFLTQPWEQLSSLCQNGASGCKIDDKASKSQKNLVSCEGTDGNGENLKTQIRKIILTVTFVAGVFCEREGEKSAGIKPQIQLTCRQRNLVLGWVHICEWFFALWLRIFFHEWQIQILTTFRRFV